MNGSGFHNWAKGVMIIKTFLVPKATKD